MFVYQFKSKICKLSRLMFHLLQFLLFYLLFLGQDSIALGDQKGIRDFYGTPSLSDDVIKCYVDA